MHLPNCGVKHTPHPSPWQFFGTVLTPFIQYHDFKANVSFSGYLGRLMILDLTPNHGSLKVI